MKEIQLPTHLFLAPGVPAEGEALSAAVTRTRDVRRQGAKVILSALYIERELEHVIGFYLYPGPVITEQQQFFADHILSSDAFTFAVKKRLVLALVTEKKALEGDKRNSFDSDLKKIMLWRNAFAHGDVIDTPDSPVLKYFEGGKREKVLTDEVWTDIESLFGRAERCIESIKGALGIPETVGESAT